MQDEFSPLRWLDGGLELLDQTRLPAEEVWVRCREPEEVAHAIRRLAVRGAPAIGVAAAYGLVLSVRGAEPSETAAAFERASLLLAATRPTAVNLLWALGRGREVFAQHRSSTPEELYRALLAWADQLRARDILANRRMGEHGRHLFPPHARVLTHCNTGALATAGFGTALGVIQAARAAGHLAHVWVDETRPLLQGARLTAWELKRLGIPHQIVTDSSAGALMQRGLVDAVITGADRIAANGDTANKIGTYSLAVLAAHHGIGFFVAAPLSTIDRSTLDGAHIPIEERAEDEVTAFAGVRVAPSGASARNFAFDVTPHDLIAAIVTEVGILRAPYSESIAAAFA